MNKPTIVFILNPVAGGGGRKVSKGRIEEIWYDHTVVFLEELSGRDARIKAFLEAGVVDFVVAGGDGTVNEVAALLMHTPARLGIVPSGSGNGLARHLGLPLHPAKALEVVRKRNVKTIDVGLINNRPFFCTAGIGFDARCAHDFAVGKHSRGLWNYVKIVFRNYFRYTPVSVEINGSRQKYFSVTFANAGQFGNDAYIAPQASLEDGYLDCAMILPHPRWKFMALGWRLLRRTLGSFPYFRTFRFKECTLAHISDPMAHIDGEATHLEGGEVEIRILEKALQVIT